MQVFGFRSTYLVVVLATVFAISSYAKNKHAIADRQDEIEVVAHLPLAGTEPITRFVETRHYRREYLYAEHDCHLHVTLLDVTAAERPTMLGDMKLPAGDPEHVTFANGNAALLQIEHSPKPNIGSSTAAQTFRLMNFADPLHPTVTREFDGVTALDSDSARGLLFLANKDGLWVLRERPAVSPEDEELQRSIERSIYETP